MSIELLCEQVRVGAIEGRPAAVVGHEFHHVRLRETSRRSARFPRTSKAATPDKSFLLTP